MKLPYVILKPGREKSLYYRHPWIFSGAIGEFIADASFEAGSLVDIFSFDKQFLARGYYNPNSDIAVRILTFFQEPIDVEFFAKRLRDAYQYRLAYVDSSLTNAYRLVFAESDALPGLILDKYDQVLVMQTHTLGMEKLKNILIPAVLDAFQPAALYERSDVSVRHKEGLFTLPHGFLFGKEQDTNVKISEHGLSFLVDFIHGQKTGFFLDQRENRKALRPYVRGKNVLNLFAYTGGFSCYALAFGANHVTSVDISKQALDLCKENIKVNSLDESRHEIIAEDVFRYAELQISAGRKFDVIIVDPPAFVKSQKNLKAALKAYSRLNALVLQLLEEGGILISSSCSAYVSADVFRKVLFQAALRAKADLVVLEQKIQPFDHPLRLYFPEGEYLKFFICLKKT